MAAITSQRAGTQAGGAVRGSTVAVPPRVVSPRRALAKRGPVRCETTSPGTLHGARLTTRGRVVAAFLWLAILVVGVLIVARASDGGPEAPFAGSPTSVVQVQSGDTLWAIAGDAQPNADPREVVDAIVAINDLASPGDIQPGDTLVVPVG